MWITQLNDQVVALLGAYVISPLSYWALTWLGDYATDVSGDQAVRMVGEHARFQVVELLGSENINHAIN